MTQATTPKQRLQKILGRMPRVLALVLCFFLGMALGMFVLPYGLGLIFAGQPVAALVVGVALFVVCALFFTRKPWTWAVLLGTAVGTVLMVLLAALFFFEWGRDEVFTQNPKTFGTFLGLLMPSTASSVQVQEGGFQDLLVLARFELPQATVAAFLKHNNFHLEAVQSGPNASIRMKNNHLAWWKPEDSAFLNRYTFGQNQKDAGLDKRNDAGFYVSLELHQSPVPNTVSAYIQATKP